MKTGNIGIRNQADIGIGDIDVYGTDRRKKNTIFDFNGTIQFYRSKNHSEGKLGAEDPFYNGEFGFDLYDKDHCPKGSVIYYLDQNGKPIENKNYSGYVAPYLSIWPPKIDKEKSSVILYAKASDNTSVIDLLKYECKEWNKVTKDFSVLSEDKKLEVEKLQTANSEKYYRIKIQCIKPFENDISIVAKYNEKEVGRIIVKANAKVYETTIQPVLINFGVIASTTIQLKDNDKFVKDLLTYFNKNSFNQAYIKGKLADETHMVTFLKSDFIKDDVVKEKGKYKNLFVNYTESNQKNAEEYNNLIEQRYASIYHEVTENQANIEKMENCIKLILNKFKNDFDYDKTSNIKKAKQFHENHVATNAWNKIKDTLYKDYFQYKTEYLKSQSVNLSPNNIIYIFINNSIEGGKNEDAKTKHIL